MIFISIQYIFYVLYHKIINDGVMIARAWLHLFFNNAIFQQLTFKLGRTYIMLAECFLETYSS